MSVRKNHGFTLIELMIGIVLSTLILSGVIEIYLGAAQSHESQMDLHIIQDNARMAFSFLNSGIASAGYIGCMKLTPDFPKNINITSQIKIESLHQPNSDSMTIHQVSHQHATITEPMTAYSILYVTDSLEFFPKETVLISDCKNAELFQIKTLVSVNEKIKKIITIHPLHHLYEKNAEVSLIESNTYFIDDTQRKTKTGLPIYALYLKKLDQPKMELVDHVENMKIQYDVNQHGKIETQTAEQMQDASNVVGVSLKLFFSSSRLKKVLYDYVSIF